MNKVTLIDTHAHLYNFCELSKFFNFAYFNIKDAAKKTGASSFTSIICLLETDRSHWYEDLLSMAESSTQLGEWVINSINNNQTLVLKNNNNEELLILPGKQVITHEKLEVIIIGFTGNIPLNKGLEYYINEYSELYLVIIPWGVGKWLGNRGKIVSNILRSNNKPFALGDNSGRTALWSHIPQFKLAKDLGINILSGSDPLPISGQYRKVAKYGSIITESFNSNDIFKQIRKKLLDKKTGNLKSYGHVDNLFNFTLSQLLLRIKRIK